MKVLAFAASNSKKSINKQLAEYAAGLIPNAQITTLDLNDYELPIYSEDREAELGQPALAKAFLAQIGAADAVIIAFAEHNGSYSAAYKNIFDWASRVDRNIFQNKPLVFLATSPGPGGAKNVLDTATTSAPYFAGDIKASYSLPSFYDNFDPVNKEITNTEQRDLLMAAVSKITA